MSFVLQCNAIKRTYARKARLLLAAANASCSVICGVSEDACNQKHLGPYRKKPLKGLIDQCQRHEASWSQ